MKIKDSTEDLSEDKKAIKELQPQKEAQVHTAQKPGKLPTKRKNLPTKSTAKGKERKGEEERGKDPSLPRAKVISRMESAIVS